MNERKAPSPGLVLKFLMTLLYRVNPATNVVFPFEKGKLQETLSGVTCTPLEETLRRSLYTFTFSTTAEQKLLLLLLLATNYRK